MLLYVDFASATGLPIVVSIPAMAVVSIAYTALVSLFKLDHER